MATEIKAESLNPQAFTGFTMTAPDVEPKSTSMEVVFCPEEMEAPEGTDQT